MSTHETENERKVTAWAHLMRASNQVLEAIEADLKAAGFPPLTWYDALLELRRAGKSGLRPFVLQEKILLTQYNLSRLIDRLVAAGYAERRPYPHDGRGHIVTISGSGRQLIKRMWPAYRESIDRHFSAKLTDKDAIALIGILDKLRTPKAHNTESKLKS